jgi:syntaxin 5
VVVASTLRGHVAATTRAFQDALRTRCDNLKEQSERRRTLARSTWAPLVDMSSPLFQGLPAPPPPLPPPPNAATFTAAAAGAAPRRRHAPYPQAPSAEWAGSSGGGGGGSSGGGGYGGASSYNTQQLARYHDAAGRAQEMRKVESTIVELGTMFSRMTTLVAEQGDVIERIDADTVETLDNVKEAQSQLETYFASVSANRGMIFRLLAVAAFLAVLLLLYKR